MNNQHTITNYYITHRDELLAFVSSRLDGHYQSEDIVQEIFTRLLSAKQMITETTLPALVYTMARNLITDFYRRRKSFEQYEQYIHHAPDEAASVEFVVSMRDVKERLERGLARLPEASREIYRLHVCDGLKVGEISLQLGEKYKSVEHRLGKARSQMRQYMALCV